MIDTKTQLRLNGYGVDNNDGNLVCHRDPHYRYAHERVGQILITAPKTFVAKIVAALDEPAACVGVGHDHAVMLFRIVRFDDNDNARRDFILKGKQCSLIATNRGAPIDVGAFTWAGNRSPFSTRLSDLAPLFADHVKTAVGALDQLVQEAGGAFGSLPTPAEIAAEAAREERYARMRQEIADGLHTPEKIAERADDELVAAWAGQEVSSWDGIHAQQVLAARRRVAARARLATAATAA